MQEPYWIQIVPKFLLNVYCPQSSQIEYIFGDYFEWIKFWRNSQGQGSHVLMLLPWKDHVYWHYYCECVYDTFIGTFLNIHLVLINCQMFLLYHGEERTKLWCFRMLFGAALSSVVMIHLVWRIKKNNRNDSDRNFIGWRRWPSYIRCIFREYVGYYVQNIEVPHTILDIIFTIMNTPPVLIWIHLLERWYIFYWCNGMMYELNDSSSSWGGNNKIMMRSDDHSELCFGCWYQYYTYNALWLLISTLHLWCLSECF